LEKKRDFVLCRFSGLPENKARLERQSKTTSFVNNLKFISLIVPCNSFDSLSHGMFMKMSRIRPDKARQGKHENQNKERQRLKTKDKAVVRQRQL
jgi:hypothetical protein